MARIHIVSPEKAATAALPPGCSGTASARSYVDPGKFPLRLDQISLSAEAQLTIGPAETECVGYVWHGAAKAGGHDVPEGSSFIIERGETLSVCGAGKGAELLLFAASAPSAQPAEGGHIHILPNSSVPRDNALSETGVSGGMHADSSCATCNVWLHENGFPGSEPVSPEEQGVGVHSHSEDEIIFIVSGQIRLGRKLFPTGTALAIPAETLYSFTPGPDGMRFVNFRAAMPSEIKFAGGATMSETEYWSEKLPRPEYLEPA